MNSESARLIRLLRFGPSDSSPTRKRRLTISQIKKFTGYTESQIQRVLESGAANAEILIRKRGRARIQISKDMRDHAVKPTTVQSMAGMSLAERAARLNSEFGGVRVSCFLLRGLYKRSKVK